jgi:hypothetical protein
VFTFGSPLILTCQEGLKQITENLELFKARTDVSVSILNVVHDMDIVPRLLGQTMLTKLSSIRTAFQRASGCDAGRLAKFISEAMEATETFLPFGDFLVLHKLNGFYRAEELTSDQLLMSKIWDCWFDSDKINGAIADHSMVNGYMTALNLLRSKESQNMQNAFLR